MRGKSGLWQREDEREKWVSVPWVVLWVETRGKSGFVEALCGFGVVG